MPARKPRIVIGKTPPGEVLREFAACEKPVQVIMGPLGSGKTHTTIEKIIRLMANQPPDAEGLRRSRWVAVRNTYPDLRGTTIKDWLSIVPEHLGTFKDSQPPIWTGAFRLRDGTRVRSELIFLALDRPQAENKLRGYQLTGVWLNEMKELPYRIYSAAFSRTGRYPKKADVPHFWSGMIGDTNAPDEDHWLYRMAEENRPENMGFFKQPGGVVWDVTRECFVPNPDAENLVHLPDGYYTKQLDLNRHRLDWIRVNLGNQYGSVVDGAPVWPEYDDNTHCVEAEFVEGRMLFIGIDFGRTPAATWGQRDPFGRMRILGELVTENMGAIAFGKLLRRELVDRYGSGWLSRYVATGDPAGIAGTQVDDRTPFMALEEAGVVAYPAITNDWTTRREAVARPLTELVEGKPSLAITPECKVLRHGMRGGYQFRRLLVAGDDRFHEVPDKNKFSHPCESLQYLMLGAGEGDFRSPEGSVELPEYNGSRLTYGDTWAPEIDL